jgi:Family of unknown function (DUF6090)
MIKFFRKIRYDQMTQNQTAGKTGKYLKYAISEIILVVIGILIALSLNNWNENRRLRSQELEILSEVKANLEATLINFKEDTLYNTGTIKELNKIEGYVIKDLPYNKELDYAFRMLPNWASPYPILTAYMTLQTKGLDIITNEKLRSEIINLYEFEYDLIRSDYDKSEWVLNQAVVTPFIAKNVRTFKENSKRYAEPNDFEKLKANDEFLNILGMIIRERESGLRFYKGVMEAIEALIKNIDADLNTRS